MGVEEAVFGESGADAGAYVTMAVRTLHFVLKGCKLMKFSFSEIKLQTVKRFENLKGTSWSQ